jgi:cytochrome P450
LATLAYASLLYRPGNKADLINELNEYIVGSDGNLNHYRRDCDGLIKLESFIKETARFNLISLCLTSRKIAGKPHVFSDGTTIPPGNTLIAPCWAIVMDPDIYPNPEEFKPFWLAEDREKCRRR